MLRPAEDIALDVLYEDADLIVLDKPAGLVVHPGAGNPAGTLVNALLHRDPLPAAEAKDLSLWSEAGQIIDYYFVAGANADQQQGFHGVLQVRPDAPGARSSIWW